MRSFAQILASSPPVPPRASIMAIFVFIKIYLVLLSVREESIWILREYPQDDEENKTIYPKAFRGGFSEHWLLDVFVRVFVFYVRQVGLWSFRLVFVCVGISRLDPWCRHI